jgi:hypothetical protein
MEKKDKSLLGKKPVKELVEMALREMEQAREMTEEEEIEEDAEWGYCPEDEDPC